MARRRIAWHQLSVDILRAFRCISDQPTLSSSTRKRKAPNPLAQCRSSAIVGSGVRPSIDAIPHMRMLGLRYSIEALNHVAERPLVVRRPPDPQTQGLT